MSAPTSQTGAQSSVTGPQPPPPVPQHLNALTAQNAAAALNPQSSPATPPPPPPRPSSSFSQSFKKCVEAIKWKGNIGTIATVLSLVVAMVYGPPAWKLAQAQLTLAIQGMRLSQWATCADHAEIQNTTTCRRILDTDFDSIGKRSLYGFKAGFTYKSLAVILFIVIVAWISSLAYRSHRSRPKLSRSDRESLVRTTHFNSREVQKWYIGFMKDVPSGSLYLAEFKRLYGQFFPFGNPDTFAALMFGRFDTDRSGSVDFMEFLTALSTTSRGSVEEKCAWAFEAYDLSGNGKISYQDMVTVVHAIYEMVGDRVELPDDESTPELRATKIWSQFDIDLDGMMSRSSFIIGCQSDDSILKAFALYNGLI